MKCICEDYIEIQLQYSKWGVVRDVYAIILNSGYIYKSNGKIDEWKDIKYIFSQKEKNAIIKFPEIVSAQSVQY